MRHFKFRVWAKAWKPPRMIGLDEIQIFSAKNVREALDSVNTDLFILMEFTGLVDSKGKHIYESDILEDPNYPPEDWERSEVKYYPEYARFGLEFYSPFGGEGYTGRDQHISDFVKDGCYVIGNIYENSYLLDADLKRLEEARKCKT